VASEADSDRAYLEGAAHRVMIQDLLARYAWELDHGSPQAWAQCFTPQGIFEAPALGFRVAGHEALAAFARDVHRTLPDVHHVMTGFVIDLDGRRASGKCFLNEFMSRPEGMYNNLQGWYEDTFVRDGARWRIEHRRAHVAHPQGMTQGKIGEYFRAFAEAALKYRISAP
jgi:hypothetical protein